MPASWLERLFQTKELHQGIVNMSKYRFCFSLIFSLFFYQASIANALTVEMEKSLENSIKCNGNVQYSDGGGFFAVGDDACMYNPKYKLSTGIAEVYLVQKMPDHWKILDEGEQERKVNSLNLNEIKTSFDIYIYMVDKKYLQFFPKGDSPYEAIKPYVQALYNYDNRLNQWVLVNQVTVTAQNVQATLSQRDDFIQKKVKLYSGQKLESVSSSTTDTPFIADVPKKMTVRLQQANYRTKPDKFDATNIIGIVKQNTDVTLQGHQKVGDTVWFLVSVKDDQILGLKKSGNGQLVKGWLSEKVF